MNKLLKLFFLSVLFALTSGVVLSQTADTEDKPRVIKAVAPTFYPAIAMAAHANGKVEVKVVLNSAGEVTSAKAIGGHPLLQGVSVKAAKRWIFSPSEKGEAERSVGLEFIYTPAEKKEDAGVFFMPPYAVEIIASAPEINFNNNQRNARPRN